MAPRDTLWELEAHSKGKHHILRSYVQAWLPIMTRSHGRVVIVDGFAGPGRYTGGEPGSPIILLNAYLEHRDRANMPSEVVYVFIEERHDRIEYLRGAVAKLAIPDNVRVHCLEGQYQSLFADALIELQDAGDRLAPTFAFIDPFGYSDAPMTLTGQFLSFSRCEVLIYMPLPFVARFLGRADQDVALNSLFGSDAWDAAIPLTGNERQQFLHDLFRDQLRANGCQYVRSFEISPTGNRGYHLFFGTQHVRGLEKMKEVMWSLDPLRGQSFSDSTNADQLVLFSPTADTRPLLDALRLHFRGTEFTIEEATMFTITDTPFPASHLKRRTLVPAEQQGLLEATSPRSRARTFPAGTRLRFVR